MSNRTKLLEYMVGAGKLLPRVVEPPTEEEKAENAVEWNLPLGDSPLRAAVRALTDAGKHPLIQPDILDAVTLLTVLKDRGDFRFLSARGLAVQLKSWYFRSLGPMLCGGRRLNVWTTLPTQNLKEVTAKLWERLGLAPVSKEIHALTTFERDVLTLRLQPQGLRYVRPREAAVRLGCHVSAVYTASQSIAKKLGIRGVSDTKALREAVHRSGVLMDDPAFQ